MANFQQAVDFIIDSIEGGYQNNENNNYVKNSNGEIVGTNMGITARTYERYIGFPPSIEDMKAMPRDHAITIYKSEYWDKFRLGSFDSQALATLVFDVVVQAWDDGAINLQNILNGLGENLKVDGIIGNQTIAAANKHTEINEGLVVFKYKALRTAQDWGSRMKKHPTLGDPYPNNEPPAEVIAAHVEATQAPAKVAKASALSFIHAFTGIFSRDHEHMTTNDYLKGGLVFISMVGIVVFVGWKFLNK